MRTVSHIQWQNAAPERLSVSRAGVSRAANKARSVIVVSYTCYVPKSIHKNGS